MWKCHLETGRLVASCFSFLLIEGGKFVKKTIFACDMKDKIFGFLFLMAFAIIPEIRAQEFVPLWHKGAMPNSRGIHMTDSVARERYFRVAEPGVFVFRPSQQENKGAAVLIVPGGGYVKLAYDISGLQLAKWFNTMGVTAFVLIHRFPGSPDCVEGYKAPLQDAQRAIRFIRANASLYGVDTTRIGVMGSSAGGHVASSVSNIALDWSRAGDSFDRFGFRPNFTILVSPVVNMEGEWAHKGSRDNLLGKNASPELLRLFSIDKQVSVQTPPAFIVHATDDPVVPSMNSILYYSALRRSGVKGASLHIFPFGKHSIALRNNPGSTQQWTSLCEAWLEEMGFLGQVEK